MSGVGIRRATPADAHTLAALAAQTFALACPPGTTQENIERFIARSLSVGSFQTYLARSGHRVWLAEDGAQAVGYAMSVHGEPGDPDIAQVIVHRPSVELSKIYVLHSHHGFGVGALLMTHAIDEARLAGASSVWLGVNQLNDRANRFYEKQGFVVRGTRFFQVGDTVEADYVREKELTQEPV
jgi:diamine N-acetyltransferase